MKKILLFILICTFLFGCSLKKLVNEEAKVTIENNTETIAERGNSNSYSYWKTGTHRNGFVELELGNYNDVKNKISKTYQQLFYGNDGLDVNNGKSLVVSVGSDMAFINTVDSNDIRSEGMSYGMTIAVMMNDQIMFDKLWKFSKTYMQHSSGDREGYFSWSLNNTAPYSARDKNPAPDGEEYFVMSLMFAKNRWGNGEGIFDYEKEANAILNDMLHKKANTTQFPMVNQEYKQIVFTTDINSEQYTDPSYHLPGFYELWAKWAINDNQYWSEMAQVSRDYFYKTSHPTTGLFPEYSTFEGEAKKTNFNSNSHLSAFDSFRVIQNIAMDYLWFESDEREVEMVNKILNFYNSQGDYVAVYTLDGEPQVSYGSQAQVAMNAVGAMISNEEYSSRFIQDLWNQTVPDGKWRYYNGLLHLLGLLHVSGEFKIYGNPNLIH